MEGEYMNETKDSQINQTKYTKMLCWLSREEIKKIKGANISYNVPLIFAKNYDDFKTQINDNYYLVFSTKKAKHNMNKLLAMLRLFPNNYFHLFARTNDKEMSLNEMNIQDEKNVSCMYDPIELVQEFVGEINVLEKRKLFIEKLLEK
jgi:hypothetical protein